MFGLAGSKSVVGCRGPVPGGVVWDGSWAVPWAKLKARNMAVAEGPEEQKKKRTTPGIPTWSPTVVLTWPDDA